ncbi:MAG: PIN domain-containing protein [Planctomycetaceae bacterium]
MILVDTRVVMDDLRTGDAVLLAIFQPHHAAICGTTRAEVLNGARSPTDRQQLLAALNTFGQVPIPDTLWDTIGDNLANLRSRGVTLPFADVVIATVAIENDLELWTRDTQFARVQAVFSCLTLF